MITSADSTTYTLPPTTVATTWAPCPVCNKSEFRALAHRRNHVAKCQREAQAADELEATMLVEYAKQRAELQATIQGPAADLRRWFYYSDGAHLQTEAEAASYRPARLEVAR